MKDDSVIVWNLLSQAEAEVQKLPPGEVLPGKSFQMDCPVCSSFDTSQDVPWTEYALFAALWLPPLLVAHKEWGIVTFISGTVWVVLGLGISPCRPFF